MFVLLGHNHCPMKYIYTCGRRFLPFHSVLSKIWHFYGIEGRIYIHESQLSVYLEKKTCNLDLNEHNEY